MLKYAGKDLRQFINRLNSATTSLRVSMLGPSGVGKTSMLASMWDQMEMVVSRSDLQLVPDADDAAELNEKILDLKRLFATNDLKPMMNAGIMGSSDWRAFDFALGRRGRKPSLRLEFIDYPGGWIEAGGASQQRGWVVDILRDSDAVLIPIDTPALMERKGLWHSERNLPDNVYNLIQLAFEDLGAPRLIILAPIRCERYVAHPELQETLRQRILDGYDKLLGHLSYGNLGELVAVVITPIQTLGGLEYHGSPMDRYLPIFRKNQPDAVYCPSDCEQPLRYVLRFAMRLHKDNRDAGYFRMIRQMFGDNKQLIAASEAFAGGCKEAQEGFTILQGSQWLNMRWP